MGISEVKAYDLIRSLLVLQVVRDALTQAKRYPTVRQHQEQLIQLLVEEAARRLGTSSSENIAVLIRSARSCVRDTLTRGTEVVSIN
jgi:hypothetical protein